MQLQVLTLEELNCQRPEWKQTPQRNEQVSLLWMKSGLGILEIDLKAYPTENNTLYCILPGQLHKLQLSEGAAGYFISFPGQLSKESPEAADWLCRFELYRLILQSSGIRLNMDTAGKIEVMIRQLHGGASGACTTLFIHLSRELEAAVQVSPHSKGVRLVRNFTALVEKHYMCWKKVKTYALELSVSATHLNDSVKRISGYCAGYHIRQRIVLEARRRAVHSGDNMKQIAYALGYNDAAHFSRLFKMIYGKRFTDFKKEKLGSSRPVF